MSKNRFYFTLFFLTIPTPLLLFGLLEWVFGEGPTMTFTTIGPEHQYTETIPVIDLQKMGYTAVSLEPAQTAILAQKEAGLVPTSIVEKTGLDYLAPDTAAHYQITLANFESVTRTFRLSDTLPPQLQFISETDSDLTFDEETRTLSWQGEIPPGKLDYLIEPSFLSLPYLDLAEFGVPDLCAEFISSGEGCDDTAVTFNLGINGYQVLLYGERLSQLTVSANGLILGESPSTPLPHRRPQWLPDPAAPNFLLAGLWRDTDMGGVETPANGRFHAAILLGLIEDHDVFYAQWHDAPHAADVNATARHAIVVVLNDDGNLAGHIFYIYDNIADTSQTIQLGYSIGIEDRLGERGTTYAYAGADHLPQGTPPNSGTTLHVRPVMTGVNYTRSFQYRALVTAVAPATVVNTAVVHTNSPNPTLSMAWSTHYLQVRHQYFLPFVNVDEAAP